MDLPAVRWLRALRDDDGIQAESLDYSFVRPVSAASPSQATTSRSGKPSLTPPA